MTSILSFTGRVKPRRTTGPNIVVRKSDLDDYRKITAEQIRLQNTFCDNCGQTLWDCRCYGGE